MTQYDPVWLDSMYNNRALVPDYATYFDKWIQTSKAVRNSQPCTLDVAYGSASGEKLDVFAGAAKDAPVLCLLRSVWIIQDSLFLFRYWFVVISTFFRIIVERF